MRPDTSHSLPRQQDGVQFERTPLGLRITRTWSRRSGGFILLWAAIWLGIVDFLTSLTKPRDVEFTLWISLPGILVALIALTRFVNRTEIDLTRESITVRHAPLPWPGHRKFATREIAAVHTAMQKTYSRGARFDVFRIELERKDGKMSTLLKGIELSSAEMYGIAEALRDHLGIPMYVD